MISKVPVAIKFPAHYSKQYPFIRPINNDIQSIIKETEEFSERVIETKIKRSKT
jgi:hypothetical protein